MKKKILYFILAVAMAMLPVTPALADNLIPDGDNLTPIGTNPLNLGNITVGTAKSGGVLLAVNRVGGGQTVFANSATVTVSVASTTASGVSAVMTDSSIALPNDWVSLGNNTPSTDTASSTVTVDATGQSPGSYSATVNYNASGNKNGGGTLDRPGNLTVNWTVVAPVDTTPPVITHTITGTLGNNGWYTSDVTVSWTATDAESSITSTSGTNPVTLTSDTAGTTVTFSATSAGGTSSDSVVIKIDKTPPTISGSAAPAPNANEWNNTDVVVTFTASDSGSGLASVTSPVTVSTQGAGQSVTGTATDNAGNSASATVSGINIDKTPPMLDWGAISPAPNANGWNKTAPVTISYTTKDNLSGVASAVPASPLSFSSEGKDQTQTVTVTDIAGNSATFTSPVVNIDMTPPLVSITGPATVILGASASAIVTASDALSGLVTDPSGSIALDTSTVGSKTISVTAEDNAGNSATATFSYKVIYGFKGLLSPYAAPPKDFKAGSSIPLKWQYTNAAGTVVNSSAAAPSVTITLNGSPIVVGDPGKSGLQYDSLTNTWQWNWQTKGLGAGTYQISIVSGQTGQTDGPFAILLR